MIGSRVRGRRFAAGVVAVLVAGLGVVACSDSGGGAAASATSSVAASASATVEVSASASASGEVTAESLSDEELGFIVTSIPEDLDAQQAEVLRAYAAYEHFTWRLWMSPAEKVESVEGADEYLTAEMVARFEEGYTAQDVGEYSTGPIRVAVLSVQVWDAYQPAEAEIVVCIDRSEFKAFDAAGEEFDIPGSKNRNEDLVTVTTAEGPWKVSGHKNLTTNECAA